MNIIRDDTGRAVAPPQAVIAPRPAGPWDANMPPIVSVCGWCPDHETVTAQWRARGYLVSHGICATCAAQFDE